MNDSFNTSGSATMVFWVDAPWRGRLGIVPRPRGGDWLPDETRVWRASGIDVVVSLLEPEEATALAVDNEGTAALACGIDFHAFPIPDRGVPASNEAVARLVGEIVDALDRGRVVAVHCRQSIGRAGLIAGAVLVTGGLDPASALRTISAARGVEVPETNEQREWLTDFAAWLAERRAI
jgi:predicted protein tyrosine phosphatase